MRQIVVFIGLLFTLSSYGQSKLTQKQIEKRNYQEVNVNFMIYRDTIKPDKYPMYPDGFNGMMADILFNLKYPQNSYRNGIQGKVLVKFIVEKNGYIQKIEVLQSAEPELDAAAVRVLEKLKTWVPGYKDGKPVRVAYLFPFSFGLRNQ